MVMYSCFELYTGLPVRSSTADGRTDTLSDVYEYNRPLDSNVRKSLAQTCNLVVHRLF